MKARIIASALIHFTLFKIFVEFKVKRLFRKSWWRYRAHQRWLRKNPALWVLMRGSSVLACEQDEEMIKGFKSAKHALEYRNRMQLEEQHKWSAVPVTTTRDGEHGVWHWETSEDSAHKRHATAVI